MIVLLMNKIYVYDAGAGHTGGGGEYYVIGLIFMTPYVS